MYVYATNRKLNGLGEKMCVYIYNS